MQDNRTNIEDRATQPMKAGGRVSQKEHEVHRTLDLNLNLKSLNILLTWNCK